MLRNLNTRISMFSWLKNWFEKKQEPDPNAPIKLVLDVQGVLMPHDQELVELVNEFKGNGVEIYACSTGYTPLINEAMKITGLDLDYDKTNLEGGKYKNETDFWKQRKNSGILSGKTIVVDDTKENCEAAKKAGLTALLWRSNDPGRIEKLRAAAVAFGYKPPIL